MHESARARITRPQEPARIRFLPGSAAAALPSALPAAAFVEADAMLPVPGTTRLINPPPRLVLIAAMSRNRVLATADGKIPWRLPRDTAHFRARAAGHWLLLGRTTFEQMRGWFQPDQVPLVLSNDPTLSVPGGFVFRTLEAAIQKARDHAVAELLVCGGGQVYTATLPHADEVILTTVDVEFEGTVFFPDLPENQWHLRSDTFLPADPQNPQVMRITRWHRMKEPAE